MPENPDLGQTRRFQVITFIHKTCGEFAAARYLDTISDAEARQLIEKELDNPEWEEILDFATQTSVAEMIADAIIARANTAELSSRLIDRAFHVLARPEICLDPPKLDAFLERMFKLAQDEDRQKAYRVGVCIANNNMSHVSEVAERSKRLLTAQAEWSRLIGWTVLVCHFPDRLVSSELENAVLRYAELVSDDNLFIKSVNDDSLFLSLDDLISEDPDRKLFKLFLINALETLLKDLDSTGFCVKCSRVDLRIVRTIPLLPMYIARHALGGLLWNRPQRERKRTLVLGARLVACVYPSPAKRPMGAVCRIGPIIGTI